ncbi:MAG: GTP cyclohydrolase I FolE2 [Methanosphaera sp.]|uniref:GTP cyclohydrolase MptA n=1 Tax=Methanosphaera sp. ISO3-F5 TaxID=1452353 RepID=UPI002B25E738|nr:GTP cyclohydrolase MptA [Methanosphaera sp. ISO3-F5]MBR0472816.1 GTP cyclohydrolase I FolE2 [Methanosphaera sp.]WQH65183.1 GTP cyclohydrolase MptA [Methanosphaera sp. ISO3-F5]
MTIKEFPDTQDKEPKAPISLTRVGVTGVKKLLKINRDNKRPIILLPKFNAFVDLPSTQKGVHMSRNPEAITEIIDESANQGEIHIETICANLVKRLLEKHEYALRAETEAKSEYIINKYSPVTRKKTQETTNIIARAIATKDETGKISVRKMIGAEVVGMTVCPCAQESVEQASKEKLLQFLDEETTEKVLEAVTFASHNQRGIGTILLEVSENQDVNVDDLIKIIQDSMSSPVCEILKRPDENKIVMNAHENPVFVEDCVRNMVMGLLEKYSDLPNNSMVTIKQVNEESIHQHNAYAEKVASFGELKNEFNM